MTETEKLKCDEQIKKKDRDRNATVPATFFDKSTVSVQCSVKIPKP